MYTLTYTIVPCEVPLCLKRESELSICIHTHTRVTYYTRRGVYFEIVYTLGSLLNI